MTVLSRPWQHTVAEVVLVYSGTLQAHELAVQSQGVGDERHLQIRPVLERGGAHHKGRTKAVSEEAKELWTWCQVSSCLL